MLTSAQPALLHDRQPSLCTGLTSGQRCGAACLGRTKRALSDLAP